MDKVDSRTLPVDALNERRRRAVKMRLVGTSLKDTAAQCEMSRTTVIAALKAFQSGGWKAVDVDRGGRPVGSGRTLTAEQEREVQRLIRDRTPDQMKMVYALWTRQAAAELIRDPLGHPAGRAHHGPVPRALGLHAAKAHEEGLRAVACGGKEVSLSGILCARHSMTTRSMYAKQDEREERGHRGQVGGVAEDPQGTA
jgi:transposase